MSENNLQSTDKQTVSASEPQAHATFTPGILCPGCPHRAAYIACKEALGRGQNRVLCGDVGCVNVGTLHPAAATCLGGENALLERYKVPVPSDGSVEQPASDLCIHLIPDAAFVESCQAGDDSLASNLPTEGRTVILGILASSKEFLTRPSLEELAERALSIGCTDAVIVDPFDSQRCSEVLTTLLDKPGLHAVVFASPCVQLQLGTYQAEPVEIDAYACMSCHRCQQITGCPAIEFTPPVFHINTSACTGCDLCIESCRTHVIYSPRSRMTPQERSRARYAAACQE